MTLDDSLTGCQPNSRTSVLGDRVEALENLKDALLIVGLDTDTLVRNRDHLFCPLFSAEIWIRGGSSPEYYFEANLDADGRFLESLAESFGDEIDVKSLDSSGRFNWKQALSAYNRLERFPFEILESPVPQEDLDGMARVIERIDRPVSEHVESIPFAMELLDRKAVDVFNVSVIKMGGIRNAQRVFDLVTAAGMECLVGTTQEMSIGTAAQAHVGAVARCPLRRSDLVGPFLYTSDVVANRAQYEDGHLVVPDGPGLGMELNDEKLDEQRRPLSLVD